jgi:hypothetical protein
MPLTDVTLMMVQGNEEFSLDASRHDRDERARGERNDIIHQRLDVCSSFSESGEHSVEFRVLCGGRGEHLTRPQTTSGALGCRRSLPADFCSDGRALILAAHPGGGPCLE